MNMIISLQSLSGRGKKVAWIPAMALSFPYICASVGIDGISILLAFALIILTLLKLFQNRYKLRFPAIGIIAFILFTFLLSLIFVNDSTATVDYLVRFVFYCIMPFIIGMQNHNKEAVVRGVLIIGFIGLPMGFIRDYSNVNNSLLMGEAYSCLPVVIVSLLAVFFGICRNLRVLALVNVCGILFRFLSMAPRGVILILLTTVFLIAYLKICNGKRSMLKQIRAIMILTAIAAFVFYSIQNLSEIVGFLDEQIYRFFHIRIYALWKIQYYLSKGNLTNGRDVLYESAIEIAKNNIFVGKGIGFFESQNDGGYCHNLFLQTICEAGLFFLLPMLYYISSVLHRLLIKPLKGRGSGYWWSILTFCCGIEVFFFSSVYWIYVPFWFLLGTFIWDTMTKKKLSMLFGKIVDSVCGLFSGDQKKISLKTTYLV